MAFYDIQFTHAAERDLERLGAPLVKGIWQAILGLGDHPRPRQSRKLRGGEGAYRLRVRDYRVIYGVADEARVVTIVAIRHRREAYR